MSPDRIKALASDLYDFAFQMVDAEIDATGDLAGRIASAAQKAFEYAAVAADCEELAARIIRDAHRDGTLEYDLTAEFDDLPVRGNAIGSGDDDYDRQVEDSILERLDGGDVWAWASVCVTCKVPGYDAVGTDYLGGCCYADADDFKQPGGYYDDMRSEARHDLQSALAEELERQARVAVPV